MPDDREGSDDPENLDEPPSFFPYDKSGPERSTESLGELVEVQTEGVFAAESGGSISWFVLVTDGERRLPILIGPYEAQAISLPLESTHPDRPMTHDLFKTIMDRMGCTIDRVVIDDLFNNVYYAKLYIKQGKEETEIDARPSDAIALAVRFEAPLFVSDGILESGTEI